MVGDMGAGRLLQEAAGVLVRTEQGLDTAAQLAVGAARFVQTRTGPSPTESQWRQRIGLLRPSRRFLPIRDVPRLFNTREIWHRITSKFLQEFSPPSLTQPLRRRISLQDLLMQPRPSVRPVPINGAGRDPPGLQRLGVCLDRRPLWPTLTVSAPECTPDMAVGLQLTRFGLEGSASVSPTHRSVRDMPQNVLGLGSDSAIACGAKGQS